MREKICFSHRNIDICAGIIDIKDSLQNQHLSHQGHQENSRLPNHHGHHSHQCHQDNYRYSRTSVVETALFLTLRFVFGKTFNTALKSDAMASKHFRRHYRYQLPRQSQTPPLPYRGHHGHHGHNPLRDSK